MPTTLASAAARRSSIRHTTSRAVIPAAVIAESATTGAPSRSAGRDWQLGAALAILAEHRQPGTPAGVVRDAYRPGQQVLLTTLAELDPEAVDMRSVVIVGSASTLNVADRMVTPRGYKWQPR